MLWAAFEPCVLLHQTIIGEEALLQMELADDYPDVVIGCFGGGSNYAGLAFPFIRGEYPHNKGNRCGGGAGGLSQSDVGTMNMTMVILPS